MVHALDEIRRTLKSNGMLIDLRPVEENWSVEIASMSGNQLAGRLNDMPVGVEDDRAAFQSMSEVEVRGWFSKTREEMFPFFYYWDTPSEMKEYMEKEWGDFEKIEEDVYQKTKSLWTSANADARVRVHVKMLITHWSKRRGWASVF